MKKKLKSFWQRAWPWLLLGAALLTLGALAKHFYWFVDADPERLKRLGSVGDALNPIVSFFAFLAFVVALFMQRRDLKLQKDEMRRASEIHRQRMRHERDHQRPEILLAAQTTDQGLHHFSFLSIGRSTAFNVLLIWHARRSSMDEQRVPIAGALAPEALHKENLDLREMLSEAKGDGSIGFYVTFKDARLDDLASAYYVLSPGQQRGPTIEAFPMGAKGRPIFAAMQQDDFGIED